MVLKDIAFDDPAFDDSLHYLVPAEIRAVKTPPLPSVDVVTPWSPDPKTELINPWRYWLLNADGHELEKQILNEGGRVIRVAGDFGKSSHLSYAFGPGIKLERGRYRFTARVRGTPGQKVELQLADDWRKVSTEAEITLTAEWKEHIIDFEVKSSFKDETTLRFAMPREIKGTFDLSDTHLREID